MGRVAARQAEAAMRHGPVVNGVVPTGNWAGPCAFLVGPDALAFAYGEGRHVLSSAEGWLPLLGRRFGRAVINSDDPQHVLERREWAAAFTPAALGYYTRLLDRAIGARVARLVGSGEVDAYAAVRGLAFAAVASTVGELGGEELDVLSAAFAAVLERPRPGESFAEQHERVRPLRALIEQRLMAALARHCSGPAQGQGLPSALRRSGAARDPRTLLPHMGILLVAGHETTAALLAWTLFALARRPAWQDRLATELARLPDEPALADLEGLPYCDAFVSEVARCFPPLLNAPRRAARAFEYAGVEVPAGGAVALAVGATHLFGSAAPGEPALAAFAPERFLDAGGGAPRLRYFTFGAGARLCLGMRLARIEAVLLLRQVLHAARLAPLSSREPVHAGFWNARPRGELALRIEPATDIALTASRSDIA